MKDHNLGLNLKKCEFGKAKLYFFVKRFTSEGVSLNHIKSEALVNAKQPRNASELSRVECLVLYLFSVGDLTAFWVMILYQKSRDPFWIVIHRMKFINILFIENIINTISILDIIILSIIFLLFYDLKHFVQDQSLWDHDSKTGHDPKKGSKRMFMRPIGLTI